MTTDPHEFDHRAIVLPYLNMQREHVLGILDGLTEEQLHQPVLPSAWSCVGVVRHLTLAAEHYWFSCILGGGPLDFWPDHESPDWHVSPEESSADVLNAYRAEIRHSNSILSQIDLASPPVQRDPVWEQWGADFPTSLQVIMHAVTETATHAGHLDVVRELFDARQWLVL